jgi:hypothetical protein
MRPLLLLLAALTLVAGCSADGRSGDGSAVIRSEVATALQIRPVLFPCMEVTPKPGATLDTTVGVANALPPEAEGFIPLAGTNRFCQVGPSLADGTVFEDASAIHSVDDVWGVQANFLTGADGVDAWNALAAQCFDRATTCPTGQMAMVVDGVTISVYSVTAPQNVGSVLISGHFTETEGGARSLVALINAGAG